MYLLEVFSVILKHFAVGEKTLFPCTYSKCFLSYFYILLLEKKHYFHVLLRSHCAFLGNGFEESLGQPQRCDEKRLVGNYYI